MSLLLIRRDIVGCTLCPRLREYCARIANGKKAAHKDDVYWGKPVPGFGDPNARLLIVGLAPAAHGANRTGRVFTGDGSGDFLMRALHANGFASIPTARRADDGLVLMDAYITAAVRCAPPDNKPRPEEITRCRGHLRAELEHLPNVTLVVLLGRIAWDAYWALLKDREMVRQQPRPTFGHGAEVAIDGGAQRLIGSYHPSRQNTNTRKLTPEMLASVFKRARQMVDDAPARPSAGAAHV